MMDGTLFDVEPIIPPPVEKLSADRRRTQLQLTRLHNGTHPAVRCRRSSDAATRAGRPRRRPGRARPPVRQLRISAAGRVESARSTTAGVQLGRERCARLVASGALCTRGDHMTAPLPVAELIGAAVCLAVAWGLFAGVVAWQARRGRAVEERGLKEWKREQLGEDEGAGHG